VKELRGQGHVARFARPVRRLGDPHPLLPAKHVVTPIEDRRQALDDDRPLAQLLLLFFLDLVQARVDVSLARTELVLKLLRFGFGRLDLGARGISFARQLGDVVFAVANELPQLLELALRRVRFALGTRPIQLVARVIELLHHRANVDHELSARLLGRGDAQSVVLQFVIEALEAGLERSERGSFYGQLVIENLEIGIYRGEVFQRTNLLRDAQR